MQKAIEMYNGKKCKVVFKGKEYIGRVNISKSFNNYELYVDDGIKTILCLNDEHAEIQVIDL